ncbi:MAG TPA: protein kinase [Blastocatellia bacterium]|nr:protein kinase [Blastocatellia bacterium]
MHLCCAAHSIESGDLELFFEVREHNDNLRRQDRFAVRVLERESPSQLGFKVVNGTFGEPRMLTQSLIGFVVDGKYRVERELGRGGMGAVYLATHLGTDRPVALKVIVQQFTAKDEFVERFRREAKAAGRLRHPNVVDVTDFGIADIEGEQVAYLVMEYLDGCSLADILAEETRLPISWVVDILEQVCAALNEAHKRGIVHRDLKPDNIWLEPNRRGGYTVKILDFGLAKLTGEWRELSRLNQASPEYPASSAAIVAPATEGDLGNRLTHPQHGLLTQRGQPPEDNKEIEKAETRILGPGAAQDSGQTAADGDSGIRILAQAPRQAGLTQPGDLFAGEEGDGAQTRILIAGIAPRDGHATEDSATLVISEPSLGSGTEHANGDHDFDASDATQILPAANPSLTGPAPLTVAGTSARVEPTQLTAGGPTRPILGPSTQPTKVLTQVGSVLGTPTYMSPEQCRGDDLDARSDIYTIGVIAYQMLAGTPPFSGHTLDVISQHIKAAPAPLRKLRPKTPKLMAKTVMSALLKDPESRPSSAAAFASAMRASLEGTGALIRHGLAIYSEHFPTLFKVSFIAHLPVIILAIWRVVLESVRYNHQIGKIMVKTMPSGVTISFDSGDKFFTYFASIVVVGVTIRLVTQARMAPLRPLALKPAIRAVKKRFWALLLTGLIVLVGSIAGLCLLVIPGMIFYVNSSLATPVVMMEGIKARRAIKRSKTLVKRSRPTVVAILLLQYSIPTFAGLLAFVVTKGFFKGMMNQGQVMLITTITQSISQMLNIVIIPFIATLSALLYLKTRMAGGEILDEVLSDLAQEDVPRTRWQMRMRTGSSGV